jgi:hypothetical protein
MTEKEDLLKYYNERIVTYNENIKDFLVSEALILEDSRQHPESAAEKLFALAESMCDLASNYLAINGISVSINNNKNEDMLNEARKTLYKSVIYIENIVTSKIDAPFSEYENNLAELSGVPDDKRYKLMCKLGLAIDLLKIAYGDNTKWKWSFVDLEARYAVIVKNLYDLKSASQNIHPDSPGYETAVFHLRLIEKLLSQSADKLNERYQLATKRPDDLRLAISYLYALKYILSIFGEKEKLAEVLRKLDVWNAAYTLLTTKKGDAKK